EQALRDRNVRLICKSDSLLMRVLDVLLFWNKEFMTGFWTTLVFPWLRAIYYPAGQTRAEALQNLTTLAHELNHVAQADGLLPKVTLVRWVSNFLFALLYLAVFFPVLLAVVRAWFECESYAVSYLAHRHHGSRYTRTQYREWMADAVGGAIY